MKIIFFGTPSFAADVLTELLIQKIPIVAVISKPDRPKGRSGTPVPTPVKLAAQAFDPLLPVYQPEIVSDPAFSATLAAYQADLFVVVAYGELIKAHLLEMPRLGCINLHTSLLPKYRGAAPIQRCLINGESETGVTIIHMVKKMDAGDVIEVARIPIGSETNFGELEQALCSVGKTLLLKVIHDFKAGYINRIPQDPTQVTFAPKIELEDCEIDWNQSAQAIHNLVRGVNLHPVAWCYIQLRGERKRLKIFQTQVVDAPKALPGTILSHPKEPLLIATGDQALQLLFIQLEGKKMVASKEFMHGISLENLIF